MGWAPSRRVASGRGGGERERERGLVRSAAGGGGGVGAPRGCAASVIAAARHRV